MWLPWKPEPVLWTAEVPVAPPANMRWRTGRNGQQYVNPEHKIYEEALGWRLKEARVRPVAEDVGIGIYWHMKDRRRDLDSILKTLFDGMQNIAYLNDRQIRELYVKTHVDHKPRLEVTLWKVEKE